MGDGGVARAEDGTELDREKGAAFVLDNSDVDIGVLLENHNRRLREIKEGTEQKNAQSRKTVQMKT